MNLRVLIETTLEREGHDLDATTGQVYRQVRKIDLRPLLRDEVRRIERERVAKNEHIAFAPGSSDQTADPPRVGTPLPNGVAAERAAWLSDDVWIPKKGHKTWDMCTISDHEARARYLRNLAAGNLATAAKHEKVAILCAEHGVDRLADLPMMTIKAALS
jgi:hypothetical protein